MALRDTVVSSVKSRAKYLGIIAPDAELLGDFVDEVGRYICNYCNNPSVPEGLRYTWVSMALDYLRWMAAAKEHAGDDEDAPGGSATATIVSSIREGDTSVSFAADTHAQTLQAAEAHSMSGILDRYVLNYADSLNAYRRMRWNGCGRNQLTPL